MQRPNDNALGKDRKRPPRSRGRKRAVSGMVLVLLAGLGSWRINDWVRRQKLGPLLIDAINHSDQAAVQRLLDQGVDPDTRDNPVDAQSSLWKRFQDWLHGRHPHAPTALIVAIKQDKFGPYYALIATLLRNGANVNAADDKGCTPLIWAVSRSNSSLIQTLIQHGAKVDARDNDGCTALIHALRYDMPVSLVWLLLDGGADVNAADKKGKTALMEAAEHYANIPDAPDRDRLLEAMFSRKVDVHAKDAEGFTTLMAFAAAGDATITRRLLARGVEINARDRKGKTALMYALHRWDTQTTMLLLEHGADIYVRDREGETVLMQTGRDDHMEELINRGADVHARDNAGRTALIHRAGYGNDQAVSMLLKHGADVNACANNGCTPLLAAIPYPDTVRLLLAHHADVHARLKDGHTALKLAKEAHQPDVVRMLRLAGAKE